MEIIDINIFIEYHVAERHLKNLEKKNYSYRYSDDETETNENGNIYDIDNDLVAERLYNKNIRVY